MQRFARGTLRKRTTNMVNSPLIVAHYPITCEMAFKKITALLKEIVYDIIEPSM